MPIHFNFKTYFEKKMQIPKNVILGQGQIRLDFPILAYLNSDLRIIKQHPIGLNFNKIRKTFIPNKGAWDQIPQSSISRHHVIPCVNK